jgi:hypothetical protein
VIAFLHTFLADDSIPCEAREHGCPKSLGQDVFFLTVIAVICAGFALAYVDWRWERGPVAWFKRWRRWRAKARAEDERWMPRL